MQDAMLRRLQEMAMGTPPIVPGMVRGRRDPNFGTSAAMAAATPRSRRGNGADAATVALAMSGLSLYWTLPAMMAAGNQKRRRRRKAHRPAGRS